MSSQLKSEASRINGAKSKGPVSVEGRARSSRNSLRHGLSAQAVVLPHEDAAHFDQLRDSYIESFRPADQPQLDLVDTLAAARWRLDRLLAAEASIFEVEMLVHSKDMNKQLRDMSEPERFAWALNNMADKSKSLDKLIRYEGSLNRTYDRAFKQLHQLQQLQNRDQRERFQSPQNEPEPLAPQVLPGPFVAPKPVPPPPDPPKPPAPAATPAPSTPDLPRETPTPGAPEAK